jgi:hypothetical protein
MPCEHWQVAKSCGQAASLCHPWMSWHSLRQPAECPEKNDLRIALAIGKIFALRILYERP